MYLEFILLAVNLIIYMHVLGLFIYLIKFTAKINCISGSFSASDLVTVLLFISDKIEKNESLSIQDTCMS